jgi:hypothetical protein
LHISMTHVEMLADFLVLLAPIRLLTVPGTIQGGLANSAVLELNVRRCFDLSADNAASEGHDCCWSDGVNEVNANRNSSSPSYCVRSP